MATLGEKVTETIISALGKGVETAGLAHHDEVKGIIQSRVDVYLALIPEGHPLRAELEHLDSNTTIVDMVAIGLGFIFGLAQTLTALGAPWAEEARQRGFHGFPTRIPDINTLLQSYYHRGKDQVIISDYLQSLGFGSVMQEHIWRASRRPLQEDEIRDLALRGEISEGQVHSLLEDWAYPTEYKNLKQKLWQRLPGVQDVIRMAVKEAFTPEIAEKFGQYADLPPKFVELAAKQGLSAEVAGWYWAAHWDLPSTTQGYEMLHRGVIKEEELDLLLRAQDVMPWWRDKLKAIAYSPLTRVDVRRMYQLGVLDEAGVVQAYKNLGYSEANAQKLLEFTRVYYGPEDETGEEADRNWTKAEILDGYRKKIITTDQARMALREMSYAEAKIDFFLAREDLKAVQTRKQAYLDRWHSLYINGIAGAQDVYTNLGALGISQAEVDEMLPLWNLEQLQTVTRPTKAERLKWFKSGIISQATWEAELRLDGYSDAYIAMYLADAQSAKEEG